MDTHPGSGMSEIYKASIIDSVEPMDTYWNVWQIRSIMTRIRLQGIHFRTAIELDVMSNESAEHVVRDACIAQYIGHVPAEVAEFSKDTLEGFFRSLQLPLYTVCREDIYGYADSINASGLPEEDWAKAIEVLKGFFAFALQNEYIAKDPMTARGSGIPKFLEGAQQTGEVLLTSRGALEPVLAPQVPLDYHSDPNALDALYFPFARCFNEMFLKASLLVYDRIWFLDPLDRRTRTLISTYRSDGLVHLPDWSRWIETYDKLSEAGAINVVSDFALYRQFDNLLAAALIADCQDSAFVSRVTDAIAADGWSIHRSTNEKVFYWTVDTI